ncbi:MAG: MFS transporter [Legionellales bacterium RIFCSPHIGHO2_12_FULL_42_9]|nr:MAG: MFS transporter [Legionellales bacterium RIFCSPHIGHO2_12_FULL_42_9]
MQKVNSFTREQKKILILSSLGGVLEYYDFIIYIFFAHIIEKLFFAESSAYVATLKTLAIFSIGYLLRPLGGILFSHFGDRYGRKVVFLLTVLFMAIPSLAIGLLPTTAQIGTLAPLLLLLFRMMQGLALGGEIPAAITFVSEHVPGSRRSFALSTLFWGINMGLMLGSGVTTVMSSLFSETALLAYGWRIPFILGGFFGLGSLYVRRHLQETAAFKSLQQQEVHRVPLAFLLKYSFKNVIKGMFIVAVSSVSVFLYLYWPQYLHQYLHYAFAQTMQINTMGTFILSFTILLGGVFSDRVGYRVVYLIATGGLVVLTYPLFVLFTLDNFAWVVFSYAIFSLIFGFLPAAYSVMLSDLFSISVRYTGIAMSYNLAFALFGGLSPLICTIAIHVFDSVLAPAIYLTIMAALSFGVCYFDKKKGNIVCDTSREVSFNLLGESHD